MQAVVDAVFELAGDQQFYVAIEDVVEPNPHLGLSNVGAILRTSEVLGFVRCKFPYAVLVRPNRHGSQLLMSYPEELVTKREMDFAKRSGTLGRPAPQNSDLRHARSAFDIARAGSVKLT